MVGVPQAQDFNDSRLTNDIAEQPQPMTTLDRSTLQNLISMTSAMWRIQVTAILLAACVHASRPQSGSSSTTLWLTRFQTLLDDVPPVGSFTLPSPPRLMVEDVGPLVYPLKSGSHLVEALKAAADSLRDVPPYGLTPPRDAALPASKHSWEINALNVLGKSHVKEIGHDGPTSSGILAEICRRLGLTGSKHLCLGSEMYKLAEICRRLGLTGSKHLCLGSEMYKLLICEAGGTPRNSFYKSDELIGTIIVQLPSQFTGGSLTVHHNERSLTLDWSEAGTERCQCAAFYDDCSFSLQPPTSGVRVCLVYNIRACGMLDSHSNAGAAAEPTEPGPAQKLWTILNALIQPLFDDTYWEDGWLKKDLAAKIRSVVETWDCNGAPMRLGYQLDHVYTEDGFGALFLKGRDRVVYNLLKHAKSGTTGEPLLDVHLVLMDTTLQPDGTPSGWKVCKALDCLGTSTKLMFNLAGGTMDGALCRDESGWWMDAELATSPDGKEPMSAHDMEPAQVDVVVLTAKETNPYRRAAIFISRRTVKEPAEN